MNSTGDPVSDMKPSVLTNGGDPVSDVKTSSPGYELTNNDAQPTSHTSESLIRQFPQESFPKSRHEFANKLSDPEIRELYQRSRLQEKEILLLRKQVHDASLNERQLLNEKHVLERTFRELQLALNEKQADAISGYEKELSHTTSLLKQKSRSVDALRMEDEEIYIFTSYLLSLLAEHMIRPPVLSASILTNSTKDATYNDLHHHHNNQIVPPVIDTSYTSTVVQGDTIGASNLLEGLAPGTTVYSEHMNSKNDIPASTFQEDPLPGTKGLQIKGEAKPGCGLQVCGSPVNGTANCHFQNFSRRVQEFENGISQYIKEIYHPEKVVTADDVDTYPAVDCIPIDDDGNYGEVKLVANNENKIACDPDMQSEINKHIFYGKATFKVLLLTDSSDWKSVLLDLTQFAYRIVVISTDQVLREEKYSAELCIQVPCGNSKEFVLVCSDGTKLPFSTEESFRSEDDAATRLRDIIVLTIRYFQSNAVDGKRKGEAIDEHVRDALDGCIDTKTRDL